METKLPNNWLLKTFDIEGPTLLAPPKFGDHRGFFVERFRADTFESIVPGHPLIQDNFSRSAHGVLRGLHYQWEPAQGKLVTCTRGAILDVAVDIRKDSKTYGQHVMVPLNENEPAWLWVPKGFAHGFLVTGEAGADVWYKVDGYYNPKCEGAIRWDDPDLKIEWPISAPSVSTKDQAASSFAAYDRSPSF